MIDHLIGLCPFSFKSKTLRYLFTSSQIYFSSCVFFFISMFDFILFSISFSFLMTFSIFGFLSTVVYFFIKFSLLCWIVLVYLIPCLGVLNYEVVFRCLRVVGFFYTLKVLLLADFGSYFLLDRSLLFGGVLVGVKLFSLSFFLLGL